MEKENMDIMKSILDDNVDIDKLDMVDFKGRFTYRKAYNMYSSGMEHFPEYIIDIIMSLYKINPEPDGLITFEELDNIDLSDEQFLLLGRDCVEQLNMRKLTSLYDEITNKDTHMLHMVSGDKLGGNQTDLEGITLNFPVINRSYIYLYRNNTLMDFVTLIHELFHAYFFRTTTTNKSLSAFNEIEGHYGDYVAFNYLRRIGYKKEADELEKKALYFMYQSSFKVYVCDLLFGLNLNNKFDLAAVAKVFQEETGIEWPYEKSDLPLLIVNGFETVSDVLSYIICNDLIENTSDEKELFNTIRRIKRNNE